MSLGTVVDVVLWLVLFPQ